MYEFEKYNSHVYDELTMRRRSDVWNEWKVYFMCSRDGVCDMPGIDALLGRRGVYGMREWPILERNGVYRVRKYMLGRDIRIDGVYIDDKPCV